MPLNFGKERGALCRDQTLMHSLQALIAKTMKAVRLDTFTLLIIVMVALGTLLPIRGEAAAGLSLITKFAIGALFFLHGARLSRQAIIAGLGHWRFHLAALALTFVLFPILGVAASALLKGRLADTLVLGVAYLCVLPSTVQSSIAYTALAKGNVPVAVCSASLSNLVGVFVTPLLVSLLVSEASNAGNTLASVQAIVVQILLPFVAGHLLRPLIGTIVDQHKKFLGWFDRGVILAIVYRAYSAAIEHDMWSSVSGWDLAVLLAVVGFFLAIVLIASIAAAKSLSFNQPDKTALVFCGMQKSLASGAPMAGILFSAATAGIVLLPLMLYHQLQLMLGAFLARRFQEEATEQAETLESAEPTLR